VVAALGALVGCGGGNPLKVGDGGSAGQGGVGQDGGGGSALDCGPNGTQTLYLSECDGGLFPYVRCNSTALPPGPVCPAPRCAGLDEFTCSATPGCSAQKCGTCGGPPVFSACYRTGDSPPVCLAVPCASGPLCSTFNDETSCSARSGCTVLSCPDCMGGKTFVGCAQPGGAGVECGPCPPTCSTFDETSCKAQSGCTPIYCPMCTGGQSFVSCGGPREVGVSCPAPCPSFCSGLDQTSCAANSRYCRPIICPDCNGGQHVVGCGAPGSVDAPGCPACPAPLPCASVTTVAACDARTDCHSVFGKCMSCDCPAPGCAVAFQTCADGGKASCKKGTPLCQGSPPDCAWTTPYVVSYTANCYEGCVRPTECGP
jgi:hypothetical protein